MNDRIIFYKYSEHIYETTIEKSYRDTNIPHNIYIDVLKEISDISMKTLIVIMNLLIEDNVITGETAEERYEKFNIYSGTVEFYKIFKDLAPNLVDRATKVVKNKIESYLRVKERLYNDKNEIYSIFGIEFEKNSQFKFDFNISDVHNGEENIVIENNNKKIIYKPRGAYLDEFWNNIIKWINRKTGRD